MKTVKINQKDMVAVAIEPVSKGETVTVTGAAVTALNDIPAGHKIALTDIKAGEPVIKYGEPIGKAACDIKAGEHIHVHNLKTRLDEKVSYTYSPVQTMTPKNQSGISKTFKGYLRKDGRAGVRNEIWIIPTVGCVNSVAKKIEALAQELLCEGIDAIVAYNHPYGCSQMGGDQEDTRQAIATLCTHPNAGGVLLLGLGCENSSIDVLKPYIGEYDEKRLRFLVAQNCEDELKEGLDIIKELVLHASKDTREDISVSKLVVGLKCGGSDGFSGITANPVVGGFSDLLTGKGGTTILTEVPEMFGAESLLMNRCENAELFQKTVDLIENFKDYYTRNGQTVYENPSPGNKAGGISTLEDKSLGCTQKSGTSAVKGVLEYTQRVCENGLNLLSAPGNDLVASTALAISGACIILFTTGRGTPFAAPVPTVKISSNSSLASKKSRWIDFDAGELLEGTSLEALSEKLYEYVILVASGEYVCSEQEGYHDMAIFKKGVTL